MANLSKQPTSDRDEIAPTKLQWTFRLLDTITQRNCWIGDSSRTVENMMEAEIVPSCQEGAFPDRFDWETLAEHWNWKCDEVTLYNEAIINVHSDREIYGRISERLRPPDRSVWGSQFWGSNFSTYCGCRQMFSSPIQSLKYTPEARAGFPCGTTYTSLPFEIRRKFSVSMLMHCRRLKINASHRD
jgi:hypothetical protein